MRVERVVIGANAHAEIVARLRERRADLEYRGMPYTEVSADDLAWADAYVGFKRPPLPTMGKVQWVHCTGAGVDGWLYPDELPRNILLTRTSESFGPRIAEWVLARALAVSQDLISLVEAQQKRQWAPRETSVLRGSQVLVVGTGDIGTHVAKLFHAVGCRVTGVSRSGRGDAHVFSATAPVTQLPELVGTAQWIILTIPLTADSRHLFNEHMLSQCRDAVLINVGRGSVVQESALPNALKRGWLKAAALDVFETEPLPEDSPLWADSRVIVSPHMSGLTTSEAAANGFLDCLSNFERGDSSAWTVDRTRGY